MANKKVMVEEKIKPFSVGFHERQILFFSAYPMFNVGKICRKVVDKEIEKVNEMFLSEEKLKGIVENE